MSALDRGLHRIQRLFVLGAASPRPIPEPVPAVPGERRRARAGQIAASIAAAVMLPIAFGAALIPLRAYLDQSVSLLMVLPVLVVALVAGRRLATLAAIAAAAAYDVFHTQPYYRPTIDDPDDIVETVVLLVIGVTIGFLAESAQRAVVAARVRREELTAMTDFMEHIGTPISDDALAAQAGRSIARLLGAVDWDWLPDYRGTAGPVLRHDGSLTATVPGVSDEGGGAPPSTIEIPVGDPPLEHGRFAVRTNPNLDGSLEERRAAAVVAATLARCIGR